MSWKDEFGNRRGEDEEYGSPDILHRRVPVEPEKLNNAQKSAEEWAVDVRERYDPVGQEGFIHLSMTLFAKELEMYRKSVALAESSHA